MNQDGNNCSGKYVLSHTNNIPIFTCEICGDIHDGWTTFYTEYLDIWRDKDNWNEAKHKVTCILGFFCYLYKEAYGVDYIFVPNNPSPYSSKDCRDAHKLLAAFGGDANIARKYLWWFFKKQFRSSISIVSINYFNADGLIRKYMLQLQKQKRITRASPLPNEFLEWIRINIPEILDKYELTTMNDLGALLQFYKTFSDTSASEDVLIAQAEKINLIKNNQLNVSE